MWETLQELAGIREFWFSLIAAFAIGGIIVSFWMRRSIESKTDAAYDLGAQYTYHGIVDYLSYGSAAELTEILAEIGQTPQSLDEPARLATERLALEEDDEFEEDDEEEDPTAPRGAPPGTTIFPAGTRPEDVGLTSILPPDDESEAAAPVVVPLELTIGDNANPADGDRCRVLIAVEDSAATVDDAAMRDYIDKLLAGLRGRLMSVGESLEVAEVRFGDSFLGPAERRWAASNTAPLMGFPTECGDRPVPRRVDAVHAIVQACGASLNGAGEVPLLLLCITAANGEDASGISTFDALQSDVRGLFERWYTGEGEIPANLVPADHTFLAIHVAVGASADPVSLGFPLDCHIDDLAGDSEELASQVLEFVATQLEA